jgi:hypothetical protein
MSRTTLIIRENTFRERRMVVLGLAEAMRIGEAEPAHYAVSIVDGRNIYHRAVAPDGTITWEMPGYGTSS